MTPSGESDIGVQRAAELLTGQREYWTVLELDVEPQELVDAIERISERCRS